MNIYGSSKLEIGENTWIGHGCVIVCSAPVKIGKNVNIAPMSYIGTGTHEITPNSDSIAGKGYSLPITIEDGSWLCAHSTIVAGVKIGSQSIVGAGAIVLQGSYTDNSLIAGCPAKTLKRYI